MKDGFQQKFIGFVDIIGFGSLIKEAEHGCGYQVRELEEICDLLGTRADAEKIHIKGPQACPKSRFENKDLDFRITRFQDSIIVSAECSPAGLANLVQHCWIAVLSLLAERGLMCRGYITQGLISHTDDGIFGSGYDEVVSHEKESVSFSVNGVVEKGTPYVEVGHKVVNYIADSDDLCLKKVFSRCTLKSDSLVALFPIRQISPQMLLAGHGVTFDAEAAQESTRQLMFFISRLKDLVTKHVKGKDSKAVSKAKHYLMALERQLDLCENVARQVEP